MEIFPLIQIRAGGLPFSCWELLLPAGTPLDNLVSRDLLQQQVQDSFDQLLASLPPSELRTVVFNARKAFFQKQKLPNETCRELLQTIRSKSGDQLIEAVHQWELALTHSAAAAQAYDSDLVSEWASLQKAVYNTGLDRALLFASHDLLARLPDFCTKPPAAFDKKDRQTGFSVLQYLARSIFKTSPLGRFTKLQCWRIGASTVLEFDAEKVAVTPNVAMLPAIYEALLQVHAFFQSLKLRLNPCIPTEYQGDALSWVYFDGEQEAFQHMQPNPVVTLLVQALLQHDRQLGYLSLLELLSENVAANAEQLEQLLRELVDLGLLEWQLPEYGLSPSWATGLYHYLSFLPSSPQITDTAYFLQSLRQSARAIPYQSVEEARLTQVEAKQQMELFFQKQGRAVPPIAPAQMFYEDVACSLPLEMPAPALEKIVDDLAALWKHRELHPADTFRSRLIAFTEINIQQGETIAFLDFFKNLAAFDAPVPPRFEPRFDAEIGALLQVFDVNGAHRAVVHALFPGGGKLFARWTSLFPDDFRAEVEAWNESLLFPWQGWSNANFQQIHRDVSLQVPDGRVGAKSARQILLTDLGVRRGHFGPELVDRHSGQQLVFTDLGLETPDSRPPMLQLLWHLGMPNVSSYLLRETGPDWVTIAPGISTRARQEFASLVLARKAWRFDPHAFEKIWHPANKPAQRYRELLQEMRQLEIPRYFFARQLGTRGKPQFFDQNSRISMQLFEKELLGMASDGLLIEEMLPTPEQWILGSKERFASEFVLEFRP